MHLHLRSNGGRSTFAPWGALTPFLARSVRVSAAATLCLVALLFITRPALAVIDLTGDVWARNPSGTFYGDNPFVDGDFIPEDGNFIDPARNPDDGFLTQVTFEGRPIVNDPLNPFDDTNENFDVYVGRSSFGEMVISGRSQLRDMNLVIGDSALINTLPRRGTGIVRIDGFGSLYNNDPRIIPYLGPILTPDPDNPTSPSVMPRDAESGFTNGFDMYVGRNGNGTLELIAGGRAEIHDAVIVGAQPASVGLITIDGIDSFLQNGGLLDSGFPEEEVHYMLIGQLGSGTMHITNGGQSFNIGLIATGGGGDDIFGAVVGSNLAFEPDVPLNGPGPSQGGQGVVTVDGPSSRWTVAGTLQIGGFDDRNETATAEDLDGNNVQYNAGVGRGTVAISNEALLSIVIPPYNTGTETTPMDPDPPDQLDIVLGRFGRLELELGGRVELIGAASVTDPQNPQQELTRGRIISDGVISGDGRITSLQFRNRVLGEVRVAAGEKLIIETIAGFPTALPNAPVPGGAEYPTSNYGLVEVIGTENSLAEIEFEHSPGSSAPAPNPQPARPLLNLPVTGAAGPNGRTEGLIVGEHSIMRFRSGLHNRGVLAFTAGDNVVSGDIFNCGTAGTCAPLPGENGRLVFGPDVNVTFEDDLILEVGSTVQFGLNSTFQILAGNSFATSGNFDVMIANSIFGIEFSPYLIAGNATFGGVLDVTFTNPGLITALSQVKLFDVGGSIFGNFADIVSNSTLELFTFARNGDLYLQAFDPTSAVGADFNGDGFIDGLDYAIWKQNYGTAGPVGDANGDGVVDAIDYTVWRNTYSPPPGSGSGGLNGIGVVPEPSSMLLFVWGGMLALMGRRRRMQ